MSKDFFLSLNELQMASKARHKCVYLRKCAFLPNVLTWLTINGYIHGFEQTLPFSNSKKKVKTNQIYYCVFLKYFENGKGLLNGVTVLSKPTKIRYLKLKDFNTNRAHYLLITSKGLMLFHQAQKCSLGGIAILAL